MPKSKSKITINFSVTGQLETKDTVVDPEKPAIENIFTGTDVMQKFDFRKVFDGSTDPDDVKATMFCLTLYLFDILYQGNDGLGNYFIPSSRTSAAIVKFLGGEFTGASFQSSYFEEDILRFAAFY
jgi:hypothetical protein